MFTEDDLPRKSKFTDDDLPIKLKFTEDDLPRIFFRFFLGEGGGGTTKRKFCD